MGQIMKNILEKSNLSGSYVGGSEYIIGNSINFNINMFKDEERGFEITHNANIKLISYFEGRETELEELRQKIEERKSILISGMGGIGKASICKKLFDEYKSKHNKTANEPFQHIGFIEYNGDLGSSLQKCMNYKQQENSEVNQEAAWTELEYLASDRELLLFIVNVDKPMKEDPGFQRLNSIHGTIVITSTQTSFSDEFETYQIGFPSTEECKEIFKKIVFQNRNNVKPEELPDLEYIIEKLAGKHPFTVAHLAFMTCSKNWTTSQLRENLEQKGFQLKFRKGTTFINLQEEYEKLFDLSELTEAEKNILEAFSVLPSIPLSSETCNQWFLSDAGVNEDDDILMGLYQKGWLDYDRELGSYVMHPVLIQFIYEKRRPKAEKHAGLVKGCQDRIKIPDNNFLIESQKYLPFAESIIQKIDMEKRMERVGFTYKLAQLLKCSGEYKKAEKMFVECLKICEDLLGDDNCDTADIYDSLGQVYGLQYEYGKAKELYEKSLRIRERVLGENHNDTLTSYNNLATIYTRLYEYDKAEEMFKKSLSIYEITYEENESEIASIYNELGGIYQKQRNFDKAEYLYKESLRIREKIREENPLLIAANYRNLASVYLNTHRFRKAEKLYKKSLSICKRVIGENHPDTAIDYNNLGVVYFHTWRVKKAETYHLIAYKIGLDKLGVDHPHTQLFYNNLELDYNKRRLAMFWRDSKFERWLHEIIQE